jgi:hypothetical protein
VRDTAAAAAVNESRQWIFLKLFQFNS